MKINICCKSPILQKTLDLYLKDYISSYDNCDFVISDEISDDINKPICLATLREDSDIRRPMHRESLFRDLCVFYENLNKLPKDDTKKIDNILDVNELKNLRRSLDSINDLNSKNSSNIDPLKSQIDNINAFISEQRRVYEEYLARNVNLFSYPMDGGPSPSINIVRKMNAAKCKELLDLLKIPSHYKHYKNMSKIFGNNSAEYPVADMLENSVIMLPKSFDLSAKNLDLIAKSVNKFKDFR